MECKRKIPWLVWRGLPGYCPFCRQWLGNLHVLAEESDVNRSQQLWITEQMETILALAPVLEVFPVRDRIYEVLMHFCQQTNQGRLKPFARSLNLPWGTVAGWIYRKEIPRLETLLSICTTWGISLRTCLLDEMATLSVYPAKEASDLLKEKPQPITRGFWNTPQTRQTLETALASNENPPPSINEVSMQIGCYSKTLRKYFPELCHAISIRYLQYVHERKQAAVEYHCEEVRQAAWQIVAQGKRPTRNKLATVLAKPGILRSPKIRKAWQSVLSEIDGEL
jgi:hypothetical protein